MRNLKSGAIKFFLLAYCLTALQPLLAQQGRQLPGQGRAAQYYLGSDDELLVPVNIWGFVRQPGQYMVPNKTDLITLLSFAGGPTEYAKMSKIEIVRSDAKIGNMVIPVDVKKYLETADPVLIPMLRPGDTIIVKGTTIFWIQRFFEFLGKLVVFGQILYFVAISNEYLKRD
ncbi:hypothetical protein KAR48_13195 [bacterium]|nr:hypothetical protein [bacterium]